MFARQKRAPVNDHVNFIRAIARRAPDFLEFCALGKLSAGEAGGDGGDPHRRMDAQKASGMADHLGIDADGGARRHLVFCLDGLERFPAKISHLARGVLAFQRGQIHHGDHHLQPGQFGAGFDAAPRERSRAFLHHHLVHRGRGHAGGAKLAWG